MSVCAIEYRCEGNVWSAAEIEHQAFMSTGLAPGKMGAKPSLSAIDFSAEVLQKQAFLEPPENDGVAPQCSTLYLLCHVKSVVSTEK
jgi:hypothetical protein